MLLYKGLLSLFGIAMAGNVLLFLDDSPSFSVAKYLSKSTEWKDVDGGDGEIVKSFLLPLQTKYYTADVTVLVLTCKQWNKLSESYKNTLKEAQLILVGAQREVWTEQKQFLLEFVSNETENEDEDEESLYGDISDMAPILLSFQDEDNQTSLLEWSIDHGMEYLAVAKDKNIDWDKKSSILADIDGWDRLAEAVLTTSWPTIERKSATIPKPQVERTESSTQLSEEDFNPAPPFYEELAREQDLHPTNINLFDNFDETIHLVRSMREKGKDMPDEERRKMAADIILQLAESLGLDSDEEVDFEL